MNNAFHWLFDCPAETPKSTLLIRLVTGGVFLWEGLIKFIYQNQGVGRFTKIGIPFPEAMAYFVAVLEIVGGLMYIFGLFTRMISIPFIIQMTVAILSTKIAVLMGTSTLIVPAAPPVTGFWAMLHETRVDFAQIICSIFLLINGPGALSLDALRKKNPELNSPVEISGNN